MRNSIAVLLLLCLPGIAAGAEPAPYSLSIGLWDYSVDGTLSDGTTRVDLFEDKEPGIELQGLVTLPSLPLIGSPAIRARYLEGAARSDERFNFSGNVLGVPVVAGASEVDLKIDVDFYDLYLIWSWGEQIQLGAGGGIKSVDAHADVTVVTTTPAPGPAPGPPSRQTRQSNEDFGFVIPALYLGLSGSVNDWISLHAEIDGLGDGDDQFVAGQLFARVTAWKSIGAYIGWRIVDIEGEADGNRLDVQADGPFAGLAVTFGGS